MNLNVEILGWFLYFIMDLIIGSSMLFAIGSHWSHSRMFRFVTLLEKKVVRNLGSAFITGNIFFIFNQGYFFSRCKFVRQIWLYSFPELFIVGSIICQGSNIAVWIWWEKRRNNLSVLLTFFCFVLSVPLEISSWV